MRRHARIPWRRLAGAGVGCLLGGAMTIHLGPTTTGQAVDQMNATSMRGVPSSPPPAAASRETMVWVPDRVVRMPGEGIVTVPGHWERLLGGPDVFVPPLTVENPATGVRSTLPAGTRQPASERVGP